MSRFTGPTYQYLQQSKIATDKFQRSLMRLKIPKLAKTCERYVAALEPVFGHEEQYRKQYEQTRRVAEEFQKGVGKQLHDKLLQYDKTVKHSSYINEFWSDMYLSCRSSLPLNFNPFLAWKDQDNGAGLNDQLVRSTNFLVSAMRFKKSLEDNILEPELYHLNPKKTADSNFYRTIMRGAPNSIATYISMAFKVFPLDMSQYANLFNSTRIPRVGKDTIHKYSSKTNRHIVVLRGGQLFAFDILDGEGNILSPELIYSSLKHIKSLPTSNEQSITELSTANRDLWAKEREHLVGLSEKNKINLNKLDSAIFVLCLDDESFTQEQEIQGAHNFLHGANINRPLNRWFDKSFSLIVTHDGHAAINFEHSWGDGVAVLRFFTDVYNDTTKNPQITAKKEVQEFKHVSPDSIQSLNFDLDERIKSSIVKCRQEHLSITSDLDLNAVKYKTLDRGYFKKHKLSPDSMFQLSFQLAYYRQFNKTPVSYESCSTAAFRGGRTETVRPATSETKLAVETILSNKSCSHNELKDLLTKCSTKHYQLCKEASMGEGFDRHLFALKEIAMRDNYKLPELYEDPLYGQSQHFTLSTSTLYGDCFSGGGFAPVVKDGFGLGYGYVDSSFGVLVANYKQQNDGRQLAQALEQSLDDIRKIVEV